MYLPKLKSNQVRIKIPTQIKPNNKEKGKKTHYQSKLETFQIGI